MTDLIRGLRCHPRAFGVALEEDWVLSQMRFPEAVSATSKCGYVSQEERGIFPRILDGATLRVLAIHREKTHL